VLPTENSGSSWRRSPVEQPALPTASISPAYSRPVRVAVVGAGAAGLVSSWLLQSEHGVTCYESGGDAGGNARPVVIEEDGDRLEVAMGPTYFLPSGYRVLMAIFAELGVELVRLPTSLTVYREGGEPRFVSPTLRPRRLRPLLRPGMAKDLTAWLKILAATIDLRHRGDTETTWGQFVSALGLPAVFVTEVAEAVSSAFLGVSFEELHGVSASSALLYLALALPTASRGLQPPVAVKGGTHRWIQRILEEITRVRLRLGDPVHTVASRREGVVVEAEHGLERYDAAVVTVPRWSAGELLGGAVAEAAALVPSTEADLVVHRDGTFRRGDRSDSEASIRTFSDAAQLTTAAGRLLGREVFRSWVTYAPDPPADVLACVHYRHPIPVPAVRRAQEMVRALDGTGGVHLVGSWTRDVDSHESAVVSAVEVALRLLGDGRRARALLPGRAPLGFGHHGPY
jgi:predicted NAD/FAD-binding protein